MLTYIGIMLSLNMDIANGPVMLVIQMSLLLSVSLGEMIRNDLCAPCVCTSKNETSGLYTVSCASNPTLKGHIPKFKHILEDQIIQLDMSNNNLHNLTSQTKTPFANFSELQELNMFNTSLKFRMNSITTIDNETFVGLSKLKVLNISHNVDLPLTNLTDEYLFNHLTSLRKLIMYQTTFIYHINKSYPSNVWKNIPSLQEIWIDGFSLEPFGKDFRNMSNLQIVVISGNLTSPIEEYPDFCDMEEITDNTLFNLVHVTDLSIVHCGIESISKNAFQNLVKLQKLDLSQNDALTLEMASRSFTSLHRGIQYLYLDSVDKVNSLGCDVNITTTMAESLSHTSLNTLSLDDNRIKSVEIDAFLKLPKTLEHLSVKQNKFELGFYMFYAYQLTNLKSIDLSYNFFGHAYSLWRQPNSLTVSRNDLNPKMTHDELGRSVAISDDIECQKPQNFIPTISVTGFLPPKLEEIDISNSKIGFPIYDFYIDTNNSLKRVIGSNSLLYCWAGPVHGVKHVEVVDLSNNFCSIVKKDFFKNMPNLKQLFLKNNNLFYVVQNKRLFYANFEIEIIDLSFNRISRLHPLLFANQTKMRIINLANNNLIEFDSRISQMKSLVSLDMSYNHMYTLTKELRSDLDIIRASRQNGSLTLNLKRNVIVCSCDNLEVLEWILDHTEPPVSLLKVMISECYFTHNMSSSLPNAISINSKQDLEFQVDFLRHYCASYTSLIVVSGIIIFIVINIIVAGIVHRFRWNIRYWYYINVNKAKQRRGYMALNRSYAHDIYLVYDEDDQDFVLDILQPKLNELQYTVYSQNDIRGGSGLSSAIANAIHDSKMVVFIVSKTCKYDSNNNYEWTLAKRISEIESENRKHFMGIVIFYNSDCTRNVPNSLRLMWEDSFIYYPENANEQTLDTFWKDFFIKVREIDGI